MAFYHTVPTYVSNYRQVTKIEDSRITVSILSPFTPTMFESYHQEANPRTGPAPPNVSNHRLYTPLTSHILLPSLSIGLQEGRSQRPPKTIQSFRPAHKKDWSVLHILKLHPPLTRIPGSGWAHGVHVISLSNDEAPDRKSISSQSTTSRRSCKDYEIWRRWDDCLWFQEMLELEYSIQAREKRRRLEQGKGVKKNGVYLDSKQAASFDSLPPGPDPNSVSLHLHDYIPKLTKKSTLFRANQATIEQRQLQFSDLVTALFAPGLPSLFEELRETHAFRDFFGWWCRDKDFKRKYGPGKGKSPLTSTFDSVPFYLDTSRGSEFFPSPTSLSPTSPLPRSKSSRSSTTDAITSRSPRHRSHTRDREDAQSPRRSATLESSSSPTIDISRPDSRASLRSTLSNDLNPALVMWDGHEHLSPSDRISPNTKLNSFPQTPMVRETFENIQCPPSPEPDSPLLAPESLSEELEPELPPPQISAPEYEHEPYLLIPKSRGHSVSDPRQQSTVSFQRVLPADVGTLEVPISSPTMTSTTSRHSLFSNSNVSMAPSWRTSTSDLVLCPTPRRSLESCTTDPVDCSSTGSPASPQTPWFSDGETVPTPYQSVKRNHRDSVWSLNSIVSVNSVMSDSSVDQVLPRGTHITSQPHVFLFTQPFSAGHRHRSKIFVPMSVPEEEGYPENFDDDVLDSYLYGEH